MDERKLKDRFAGALLGTMVGDQLGAPFEGQPPEMVTQRLSLDTHEAVQWLRGGRYTDDTQMMIGVAESLADCGGFDGAHMAGRFADNYDPHRGYGGGAHVVLAALQAGHAWDQVATLVFPDGSFGNGAAMRVAPVGVFYRDDPAELRNAAEGSAAITHAHPLGKEGAVMQACAVALAARTEPEEFDPVRFLGQLRLLARLEVDEYVQRLDAIEHLLGSPPDVDGAVEGLGNDIRAHTAVPAAIYAFLSHPDSFSDAVLFAVLLGGDTDTIGAMAGAIAGALHGASAIPANWLDALENSTKGRDHVMGLAERLYGAYCRNRDGGSGGVAES